VANDWCHASWEVIGEWPFQWVPHLVAKLRERNLVAIDAPNLWVASDYSGAQRGSRFFLIGVHIGNSGDSSDWERLRLAVRQRYLSDGRRMSFKALNDGQRRAALKPFLNAADAIRGVSVVFAIDKRLHHFAGFDGFHQELKERNIILGNWKSLSFERMVTVTHIISVLLGLVTKEGQNVTWISDADDLFATEVHKRDCAKMMSTFSSLYVRHGMGQMGIGTTDLDEGDRFEEDFTAIPDLAAGAVGELFNKMCLEFGKVPGITTLAPRNLSRKSDLITSWFFHPNKWHQKIACVIQKIADGHTQIGTVGEDFGIQSSLR
jgi:hypothetical protein